MPWWLPVLFGSLALAGIIVAVIFGMGGGINGGEKILKDEEECEKSYFFFKGQCVKCPEGSRFNGTDCVKTECVSVKEYPGRVPGKKCSLET